ncbi:polynucleotide kinase-phosphatase [Gordonia soli]|uniref:Serine/threonine protein phosphatase PrpA n=1 Tax=Gordonia soli NBRC 108243 TaxID=1223545 RepID=M0QJE0_9ACTN|nr:polynucleotide kinase-phosphatase [Gordonia soli]GAC68745.1 serine/threonine protein phosphatase PrpA [Gordonia soli NBRC 108243]
MTDENAVFPVDDAASPVTATGLDIPALCLVVLVGVSGAGKSTFARRVFQETEVLSSDAFRGLVADDPTDQSATTDAFSVIFDVAARRLRRGLLTVVDATSVRPEDRRALVDLAKEHDVFAVAIVLDVPLDELTRRTAGRTDVDGGVVVRQHRLLRRYGRGLRKEGFRFVHILEGVDAIDAASITRTRLFSDRTDETGPFDIIGDVHGCHAELVELLERLGWRPAPRPDGAAVATMEDHPDGRRVIFVGDLVDRGPDTPAVLRLVMSMVAAGQAICVRGNHEEKLLKALRQRTGSGRDRGRLTMNHGLAESLAQLAREPDDFVAAVITFLDGLVSHYLFDGGRLVVAHAGLAERYHGRSSGRVRSLAMYGETSGEVDRHGFPIRIDWARDYRGAAAVVYGHTPVPAVGWVNNTLCIDTGCVFGGRLTALRHPERETVAVSAHETYWEPERPMGYGDSDADARVRARVRLDDVAGKRVITTRLGPSVTVRAEHAASALEVMSRYAVDPRWLRYLPPTMSPVGGRSPGLLEDPDAAFDFYARSGVAEVICEEKHMGSRAMVVVTRDQAAAASAFGVVDGLGAIVTRTGRTFFDAPTTADLLDRTRDAASGVLDTLQSDWLILDAELLPWNIKGEGLIRDHFAAVSAAAGAELDLFRTELSAAADRGLDVGEMLAATQDRRRDVDAFTAAYGRYVDATATIADVRIAPFEILAHGAGAGGVTAETQPHSWHLDVADQLVEADPSLFASTRRCVVDVGDPASRAAGGRWWTELTAAGGEGMVVKPAANAVRDDKGRVVAPGVKVRSSEYLRIIYGPSYLDRLEVLRERDLRHKRSMALREYLLGREALARHVAGEPLWRVHECVFGLLALESEPVDSRL